MVDTTRESHTLLHSFCIRPPVKFETQMPDEEVILVLRAHPITQIGWIINGFVFLIILLVINPFIAPFLNPGQSIYLNIFLLVMILNYLYFNFLNYFFHVGIITNQRIVDIDFHGVAYKEFTTTRLDRVEDITSKSGGFIASIFNFGDIFIQTAGSEANIEFHKVANPQVVATIINNFIGRG
jgi:uncharacterized membrane protein YdbT with pleckstrin-like domain